jgi:deazaflavin-dependent oxidoreductase (nitroreductase family)
VRAWWPPVTLSQLDRESACQCHHDRYHNGVQTNLCSSAEPPNISGDRRGAGTPTASRSEILHWESLAWLAIGAAWVVSAWPGVLVRWDGVAGAAVLGLGVLAGFGAWQVVVHGARPGQPSSWVGARWRAARPGSRAKSRRLLAVTVMLDAAAWSVSGISWMLAARAFDWSQTLTGAPLQLACGVAFLGWGLLHIPAARRLVASADDVVVVSRRVLGSGPPTIDTKDDATGEVMATALRTKQRRVRLVQRRLLKPPTRVLTYLGLLRHHAVLETTGRRTGRPRRTIVGIARPSNSVLWIVAEHGRRAGYVRNLAAQPNVRIRVGRRWQRGVARLVENDDIDARLPDFTPQHVDVIRRFGTEPCTLRVELVA